MKKILMAGFGVLAASILYGGLAHPASAATIGYAGLARVSDTERDNATVQARTLDEVRNINRLYYDHWGRDARVDELQFHVDHTTPHDTLAVWLDDHPQESTSRYNVGTEAIDRFAGQTVSTDKHEFYLVQNGKRWIIPDFPTMNAWGLLFDDRWSVLGPATAYFEEKYPLGGTLNYADGLYYDEIQQYWAGRDGNDVPETLPTAMRDMFLKTTDLQTVDTPILYGEWLWLGIHTSSPWVSYTYSNLLDWSYLH